jgi:hypothetical protein
MSALCAMNDGMGKVRLRERSNSGLCPRAVPMIVFHGDADDTVHPRNSDQIVAMRALLLGDPNRAPSPASTRVDREESGHAYTRHIFHDDRCVAIGEQWLVCVFRGSWTRVSLEAGQVFRAKLDSRSAATQGFLFLL